MAESLDVSADAHTGEPAGRGSIRLLHAIVTSPVLPADTIGSMADENPFYAPGAKPLARKPVPGEPLWALRKNHITWSCELRFHGESYGWEAQILRNEELVIGRRFLLKEQAVRWAEQERQALPSV